MTADEFSGSAVATSNGNEPAAAHIPSPVRTKVRPLMLRVRT
jgi:hypothetical protein